MSDFIDRILQGESVREVVSNSTYSDLSEMANIVGKYVTVEPIDFSFYFSDKTEVNHGIRAKVKWNKDHLAGGTDGYFELHGNYKFVKAAKAECAKEYEIEKARHFFKKYKVLFAAVWESCLDANSVQDYLKGYLSFGELIKSFLIDFDFSGVTNIAELEKCVRDNNLFNMND